MDKDKIMEHMALMEEAVLKNDKDTFTDLLQTLNKKTAFLSRKFEIGDFKVLITNDYGLFIVISKGDKHIKVIGNDGIIVTKDEVITDKTITEVIDETFYSPVEKFLRGIK